MRVTIEEQMEKIIDDWFSDNFKLFNKDIEEYYIDKEKWDLIEKLNKLYKR